MLSIPAQDVSIQPLTAVPQFWSHLFSYSYLSTPRTEDALILFLPDESGCRFTLELRNRKCYYPTQGDIVYTPKGSRFLLYAENEADPQLNRGIPRVVTNLCIKFQVVDGQGANVPLGDVGILHPTEEAARQCRVLMRQIVDTYRNVHNSLFLMKSKMYELIYLLSENEYTANNASQRDAMTPVLQYMRRNLSQQVNVEELAALCSMSPAVFYRTFRACMGQTPKQYWMEMRIAKAKEMLDDPLVTVADVAFHLGYFDVAHFCKQFRAFAGVTPHQYRLGL